MLIETQISDSNPNEDPRLDVENHLCDDEKYQCCVFERKTKKNA